MATNREYTQLVSKLTELTQSKQIEWNRNASPASLQSPDNKVDIVYVTDFKDKKLRLYEERYKYFTDEDEFHWADRVILEFIDQFNRHVWQFPEIRTIWDLLRAVKYEEAGVDSFIKQILEE